VCVSSMGHSCLARGRVANAPRPVSVENAQARMVTSPGDCLGVGGGGVQNKKLHVCNFRKQKGMLGQR
jgi:hypothetical protein